MVEHIYQRSVDSFGRQQGFRVDRIRKSQQRQGPKKQDPKMSETLLRAPLVEGGSLPISVRLRQYSPRSPPSLAEQEPFEGKKKRRV